MTKLPPRPLTPDEELSLKFRRSMIRDGICPNCAKRLDPPRMPTIIRTRDDAFTRIRTCYNCEETFSYSLDED